MGCSRRMLAINLESCLPLATSFSLSIGKGAAWPGKGDGAGHSWGGKSCCLHPYVLPIRIQVIHTAKTWNGNCPPHRQEPGPILSSGPLLVQEHGQEQGCQPEHPSSSFHYSHLAPSLEQGSRNNRAVYKAAPALHPIPTTSTANYVE